MLSIFLSCKTSFCYAYNRLYHTRLTRASHETRNILVFYEIKKPNKIGGLVMVAPRECYETSGSYTGYALVTHGTFSYNAHSAEGKGFVTPTTRTDRRTQHRTSTVKHRGFLKPLHIQHPSATQETRSNSLYSLL